MGKLLIKITSWKLKLKQWIKLNNKKKNNILLPCFQKYQYQKPREIPIVKLRKLQRGSTANSILNKVY